MDKQKLFFLAVSAALLLWSVRFIPKHTFPLAHISIAVASDLHYLSPALTDYGSGFHYLTENGDGKDLLHGEEITDAFLDRIRETKPTALLLTGDLTFNGARKSHVDLIKKLMSLLDDGIRVLVLPGNHDLNNHMAASFSGDTYKQEENINTEGFAALYAPFGYSDALSRDTDSLSYIAELTPGLRVMMLDVNGTVESGTISEETLLWIRRQLEEARRQGARVISASHQTILAHNSVFIEEFQIQGADKLEEIYEQYHVICNFSGHMHIQHIEEGRQFPDIASSCLLTWPIQYGMLSIDGNSAHYYTIPVEPEGEITQEAYWLLWNTAYRQAGAELTSGATVASGVDGLCNFFAGVNTRYIAGLGHTIHWDDVAMREWQERGAGLAAYLESIRADGGRNWTEYHFQFR